MVAGGNDGRKDMTVLVFRMEQMIIEGRAEDREEGDHRLKIDFFCSDPKHSGPPAPAGGEVRVDVAGDAPSVAEQPARL